MTMKSCPFTEMGQIKGQIALFNSIFLWRCDNVEIRNTLDVEKEFEHTVVQGPFFTLSEMVI